MHTAAHNAWHCSSSGDRAIRWPEFAKMARACRSLLHWETGCKASNRRLHFPSISCCERSSCTVHAVHQHVRVRQCTSTAAVDQRVHLDVLCGPGAVDESGLGQQPGLAPSVGRGRRRCVRISRLRLRLHVGVGLLCILPFGAVPPHVSFLATLPAQPAVWGRALAPRVPLLATVEAGCRCCGVLRCLPPGCCLVGLRCWCCGYICGVV